MEQNANITNLVIKAKQGDGNAFEELYKATYSMVNHTCLSHMKYAQDVEDAVQDVYVAAFKNINTLKDNYTFYGWLKTIAVHTCLNAISAKGRFASVSYDDAIKSEEILEGDDNLESLPDTYILRDEKRKIILDILYRRLSEIQYQTVVMFYYDNMSVEHIASVTNCSVNTVKTRLKNARVKIKAGIEDYENKTGDRLAGAACTLPFLAALFNTELASGSMKFMPYSSVKKAMKTSSKNPSKKSAKKPNPAPSAGHSAEAVGLKIIASVAALGIVGGGAYAVANLASDSKDKSRTKTSVKEETTESNDLGIYIDETTTGNITEESVITSGPDVIDISNGYTLPRLEPLKLSTDFSYEQAYTDLIYSLNTYESCTYNLIPVNNDGIPELVVKSPYTYDTTIYTYHDGVVSTVYSLPYGAGGVSGIEYFIGQNLIFTVDQPDPFGIYIDYGYMDNNCQYVACDQISCVIEDSSDFIHCNSGHQIPMEYFSDYAGYFTSYITDPFTYTDILEFFDSHTVPEIHICLPIIDENCTWESAQKICYENDGFLAVLTNEFITVWDPSIYSDEAYLHCNYYLGGQKDSEAGIYKWTENNNSTQVYPDNTFGQESECDKLSCNINVDEFTGVYKYKIYGIPGVRNDSIDKLSLGYILEYVYYGK